MKRALAPLVPLLLWSAVFSCSRENELRGDGTRYVLPPRIAPPDSGIPTVYPSDDLLGPSFATCEARTFGDCYGGNDFPCAFDQWARRMAAECQRFTGCRTNGWISFETNALGCVSNIGMTIPTPEFADCLREVMGNARCPCGVTEVQHFMGVGHDGCEDDRECGGAEFPCATGFTCVNGRCEPGDGG